MTAVLCFDDPLQLLSRLANPKDHGLRRLKIALSYCSSAAHLNTYVIPFLELKGAMIFAEELAETF